MNNISPEALKILCDELTRYLCYLHGQLRYLRLLSHDGRLSGLKIDQRVLSWFERHDAWDRYRVRQKLSEYICNHSPQDFIASFIHDAEEVQPLSEWHKGEWIREVVEDFISSNTERKITYDKDSVGDDFK